MNDLSFLQIDASAVEILLFHFLFMFTFVLFPLARVYKRAGVNQIGAAAVLIPGIGVVIALAILAFSSWKETK